MTNKWENGKWHRMDYVDLVLHSQEFLKCIALDAILVRVFTLGVFFFFFCKWCDDMLLLIFIRPLYPECVLESWPPSSGDPGQWNIWSDCSRTRQTDADSARPLWRRALGSGPAPQEATSCDRQRWPLCKVRPQQWLSSSYFFGITGLFCPNLPVA